ncbi:retrovirus-related pol polyprotein from transposon TNT 1-94, partial [Tanacetum coccineum]
CSRLGNSATTQRTLRSHRSLIVPKFAQSASSNKRSTFLNQKDLLIRTTHHMCTKLKKALYDLKQALRAWYDMLSSFLISQHFSKGPVDPTLFTWQAGNDLLLISFFLRLQISQSPRGIFINQSKYASEIVKKYVLLTTDYVDTPMVGDSKIYVDDIIFASTNTVMCNEFANQMTTKFKMSMIGQMSFFLGLQIYQSPRGIFINQSKYAFEIVKKYVFLTTNSVDIAMVEKSKLDEDLQGKLVVATLYRGIIGSLMYLTFS